MRQSDFDSWAERYDEDMPQQSGQFPFIGYYDVLNEVQKLVSPGPGLSILDIGTGTGTLAAALAGGGCEICGVDSSRKMIDKAKVKVPGGKFDIVDVSQGYLGKFSHQKFNRIISTYWLHHFDDDWKVGFLEKVYRRNLIEGGSIVMADIGFATEDSFETARTKYQQHWDNSEHYLCGERLLKKLATVDLRASYRQVSECAGVLVLE